jgi:hypothetical protein
VAEETGTAVSATGHAEETRTVDPAVTPARAAAEAREAHTSSDGARARPPLIAVAGRDDAGGGSRTAPRMRFDVLQIAAWVVGLYLIVGGLVAVARAGFDDLALFEPVVEVGDQTLTPVHALLWLIIGAIVLSAGSGVADERRLRLGGVVLGIVGAVFLIEPDAFTDYLGVTEESGTMLLAVAALLVAASFVPPLSIARPGMRRGG